MSHAQPAARLVSRAAELLFYAAIQDQAVAGLVEAGVRFLEALAGPAASAEKSESPPKQGVSKLIRRDPETKRPILAVPVAPTT